MSGAPRVIQKFIRNFLDSSQGSDLINSKIEGGGGALFPETESIELIIQWENFLEDEESSFETFMDNEDQADAITSSEEAMLLIFDLDQR